MRQVHKAGEKAFVDYSGKGPRVVNPDTGDNCNGDGPCRQDASCTCDGGEVDCGDGMGGAGPGSGGTAGTGGDDGAGGTGGGGAGTGGGDAGQGGAP